MASLTIADIHWNTTLIEGADRIYLQKKYNLDIPFIWKVGLFDVGDASASGAAEASLNFATALGGKLYYVITEIFTYMSGTACDIKLHTNTDQWQRYHVPGCSDMNITLWSADGLMNSYPERDKILPLFLGRPSNDSSGGLCWFRWDTHTESVVYSALLMGYALKEPPQIGETLKLHL